MNISSLLKMTSDAPNEITTEPRCRRAGSKRQFITCRKRKIEPSQTKTGRWERSENVAFLRGLKYYGKGKWKQIGALIPTRYVHSHHLSLVFCTIIKCIIFLQCRVFNDN
mmetsp:Transcript_38291/g.55944  ORF Transcript_38291/g.55944 Transcript_38291/m.55944 type:complete len:110 (-) Transcript_38291:681-1010(-)